MVGHGDPGLDGPVAMDGATEITAEGGIGAASLSTLGLIGSSVTIKKKKKHCQPKRKYSFCHMYTRCISVLFPHVVFLKGILQDWRLFMLHMKAFLVSDRLLDSGNI